MTFRGHPVVLAVAVVAVALGACGSGPTASTSTGRFEPPAHSDSGGGAEQFEARGGDNSIQESGTEASGAEFEEAAAALHAYLDARAAGAWAVACEYLAPELSEQFAQLSGSDGGDAPSCAVVLQDLSAGTPPAALRESAVADVGSVRVEGDAGFLLFHGARGVDYFVSMARVDGHWRVAALAPSALR